MSVLITVKVKGDTDQFVRAIKERASDLEKTAAQSKAAGAIHHRFGVGDGFVLVVDEWDSAEHFQQFFTSPELQAFIGELGGDTSSPPDITITEAIESPDEF
jgi:quinol monooxygenase YgiN